MSLQRPPPIQLFHRSNEMNCPYLEGEVEQQLFTEINGEWAQTQFNKLSQAGFRRSHNIIYRPTCPNCSACKSVRISADKFKWKKSWKRVLKVNDHLTSKVRSISTTDEQFELFDTYVKSRHIDGEMANMTRLEFENMMMLSPVESQIVEYRDQNSKLVAAVLVDVLQDGWSAVYSFFEPSLIEQSLGSYIILDLVQKMERNKIPYVYLGYWIKNSAKMQYKERFQPLEFFHKGEWIQL